MLMNVFVLYFAYKHTDIVIFLSSVNFPFQHDAVYQLRMDDRFQQVETHPWHSERLMT